MLTRDIYRNLSPLDHRYWTSNPAIFERLSDCLSEEAVVGSCVRAELALVKAHLEFRGRKDGKAFAGLDAAGAGVLPETVYEEEERTRHNIRALVNVLKKAVDPALAPLVHLGATSVDILDTAQSLRVRDAVKTVVLPLLADLLSELCSLAEREAETPQVGRTHGQHAVPVTFGFAMAEYASRLGKCLPEIDARASDLRGKLAGATGSYNALSMIYADPEAVERAYLGYLGLLPSEYSTQLVEPEYLLRLLLEMNAAFGVIANLADDLRNLQRSEIDELREFFSDTQVGSSTMPQKRNPWNSEHVKSLWKAFFPRSMTFFMDQISEHQRDLTNSASSRFIGEFIAGFCAAANRMLGVLRSLDVNGKRMLVNLRASGGGVLAEPAYILLAETGVSDAHEVVRKITLVAEREGITFGDALGRDPEARDAIHGRLRALGYADPSAFFSSPERYRGKSAEKARSIASKYAEIAGKYRNRK